MAHLVCQLHLESTKAQAPVRDFLDQTIWGRQTHPKCRWHLLVAAQIKGHGRRKFCFLPVCLHSWCQVYLSCCWCIPSLLFEAASSGFQHRLEDRLQQSRNSLGLQCQIGIALVSSLVDWGLNLSSVQRAIDELLRAFCVSHSNTFPIRLVPLENQFLNTVKPHLSIRTPKPQGWTCITGVWGISV